jgi:hypothetical protein
VATEMRTRSLAVQQGVTFTFEVDWLDDGVRQSLDGWHAILSIAKRDGVPPVAVVRSEDGEIDVEPDGRAGWLRINVPPEKTALLTPQRGRRGMQKPYSYDVVVWRPINGGREAHRLAHGEISVSAGVTRLEA